MKNLTRQDIMNLVVEEDVEFIRLQFTDIFGNLKNVAVTSSQLERALNNECMFDGSSIEGFTGRVESDMYLYPDLNTMTIFPWRPQQGRVARLICDIYRPNGKPFEGDPRYILKCAIKEAADMGYTFDVGPECEFFLFDMDENGSPTTHTREQAGYFDMGTVDFGENARRDMILTLEEMGYTVESSHHSKAPAQHAIDFQYGEALHAADYIMTFKLVVKTIAKQHGLHATFMPKPKFGVPGSGMHINLSLNRNGENIFGNDSDWNGLSAEAYYFIGGIMKHLKGMTAITNPLVNSYKRLVPGYDAPVHIAWSIGNRSPLIRVPDTEARHARIELRNPDPCANPYLALAVCLRAGLDGIKNQIMPPESVDENIQEMSREDVCRKGIESIPATLLDALHELEKDELVMQTLGEHVTGNYIKTKRQEWQEYISAVSEWEIGRYLLNC